MSDQLFLRVSGTAFDRGKAMGTALRGRLKAFMDDRCARLLATDSGAGRAELMRAVERYREVIEEDVPELYEELCGLAAGAELTRSDAVLLQCRRELFARGDQQQNDCSTIAALGASGEGVSLAQTVDLSGNLAPLACVVESVAPHEPRVLMFTLAGTLGYLGLNEAGLAVGINMVHAAGWRPGVSPYLLVRQLLRHTSVSAALDDVARIRRASSRALTISDGRRLVCAELTVDEQRVTEASVLLRTNHYLHPELEALDTANVLMRRNSRLRLARLKALWAHRPSTALTCAWYMEKLSDHEDARAPLCIHGTGDERRSETVAAVVLRPQEGRMHVRFGAPCTSHTKTFALGGE